MIAKSNETGILDRACLKRGHENVVNCRVTTCNERQPQLPKLFTSISSIHKIIGKPPPHSFEILLGYDPFHSFVA